MGIPSYLVGSTVIGVIAQRLVRRLCSDCKIEYEPGMEVKKVLGLENNKKVYKKIKFLFLNF
jgi:type IV pilus assembly protein PilB